MNCLQLSSRRRQFILVSLNELLISTVQKSTYFTAHQDSRMNGKSDRIISVAARNQHCRRATLGREHSVCDRGIRLHIEGVSAQDIERLIEVRFCRLSSHRSAPV